MAAFTAAPVTVTAAAVPPAPLRPEHSAHAPSTTATSVAPRTLSQRTAASVTFTAAPVTAFTAAPVAATAAVPPAPLRPEHSALAPCTCYGSKTRPSRHVPATAATRLSRHVPRRLSSPPLRHYGSRTRPSRHVPRRLSSPPLCRYGNRTRPSRHVPATAAKLGPRAMYLGGFHRPHCAATATVPGPRAMYLLRQQHPALAPFIFGTSDSDHSQRSDHDRRDHR